MILKGWISQIASTNAAIAALLEAQAKETEALGKLAKAAKEQGDTLVALAKLQGDEKSAVEAAAQAAELYAAAQAKVAASRAQEVALLEQQLRGFDMRRQEARQRQIDPPDLIEIDRVVDRAKPFHFVGCQRQRRIGAEMRPFLAVEEKVGGIAVRLEMVEDVWRFGVPHSYRHGSCRLAFSLRPV